MRLVSVRRVARVEERFRREHVSGVGKSVVTRDVSVGWWVVTEGPEPLAVCCGSEQPSCEAGDEVRVVMEIETRRSGLALVSG